MQLYATRDSAANQGVPLFQHYQKLPPQSNDFHRRSPEDRTPCTRKSTTWQLTALTTCTTVGLVPWRRIPLVSQHTSVRGSDLDLTPSARGLLIQLRPTTVTAVCCVPPVARLARSEVAPQVAHLLTLYSQSKQSDLQQRCLEFMQLAREGPSTMAAVLPVDASCEDVEVLEPDVSMVQLLSVGPFELLGYKSPCDLRYSPFLALVARFSSPAHFEVDVRRDCLLLKPDSTYRTCRHQRPTPCLLWLT